MYSTSWRLPVTKCSTAVLPWTSQILQLHHCLALQVLWTAHQTITRNGVSKESQHKKIYRDAQTFDVWLVHSDLFPLHSSECPDITAEVTACFVTDRLQCWNGQFSGMAKHVAGWGKIHFYWYGSAHVELPFPIFTQNKIRAHRPIGYQGWGLQQALHNDQNDLFCGTNTGLEWV